MCGCPARAACFVSIAPRATSLVNEWTYRDEPRRASLSSRDSALAASRCARGTGVRTVSFEVRPFEMIERSSGERPPRAFEPHHSEVRPFEMIGRSSSERPGTSSSRPLHGVTRLTALRRRGCGCPGRRRCGCSRRRARSPGRRARWRCRRSRARAARRCRAGGSRTGCASACRRRRRVRRRPGAVAGLRPVPGRRQSKERRV